MGPVKTAAKRILLYGTALLIVLVLGAPFFLEPLINSKLLKSRLSNEIHHRTGVSIAPEEIAFMLFPLPGIRLIGFDHSFNDQFRLIVAQTEIELSLMALIQGRIAVDRIQMTGPRLLYTPPETADGQPSGTGNLPGFSLKTPENKVKELFALFPDSQDNLEVLVKQAATDYFDTMDAQFTVFRDNPAMVFNARIMGIDLSHGRLPVFDRATQDKLQSVRSAEAAVTLRLDNNTLFGTLRLTTPQAEFKALPGRIVGTQDLAMKVSLSREKVSAVIEPVRFNYPGGEVGVEFSSDAGRTAVSFSGKDIDISQARDACLPVLGGEPVVDSLFDILRAGTAEDITVAFSAATPAALFNAENLLLRGAASGATVHIPGVPLVARKVSGGAGVKKGVLSITTPRGRVDAASITGGRLDIDLLQDQGVPFEGEFSLAVDAKHVPATLINLLPDTELANEMKRVSDVSGYADATLGLRMAKGQTSPEVDVRVKNFDIRGRYGRIPLPVRITGEGFAFSEGCITLTESCAELGRAARITGLTGRVDLTPAPVLHIETAAADLSLAELMPWMAGHSGVMGLLSPAAKLGGIVRLDTITVDGPMFRPGQWRFRTRGAGRDVAIGFGADEPAGRFAVQAASALFQADETTLKIDHLNAGIHDLSWLEHRIHPDRLNSIRLPLQVVDTSIVKKSRGDDFLHGKLQTPAGPLISFDLTGERLSDMDLTLLVLEDPDMTEVMIVPNPAPDKPRISFEGTLNTLTLEKLLVPGSPLYNQLISLTAGDPVTIYTDKNSQVHVKTDRLNLDALLTNMDEKQQTRGKGRPPSRPLLAQKAMFFEADALTYKNREFTRLDTRVFFGADKTRVRIHHADLCDLSPRGYVDIIHGDSPRLVTAFHVNSDRQKDISAVLRCLFRTDSLIEGGYTLDGSLTGNDTPDRVWSRQNGRMHFEARSGRIYKATLLSRVLSVLNVFSAADIHQQGFAYKRFTIAADVENSVIRITKAYIDAEDMAIIASGWVDPLNDRIDLTFLVAPLKTIDTIIQNIPLVNTILSGRLVSFPAKATGKLSDPSVIPLHPSAVGKGLVNLLGDLIKAPVRLFQGNDDQ